MDGLVGAVVATEEPPSLRSWARPAGEPAVPLIGITIVRMGHGVKGRAGTVRTTVATYRRTAARPTIGPSTSCGT
jgi:hypothetical protein